MNYQLDICKKWRYVFYLPIDVADTPLFIWAPMICWGFYFFFRRTVRLNNRVLFVILDPQYVEVPAARYGAILAVIKCVVDNWQRMKYEGRSNCSTLNPFEDKKKIIQFHVTLKADTILNHKSLSVSA